MFLLEGEKKQLPCDFILIFDQAAPTCKTIWYIDFLSDQKHRHAKQYGTLIFD
jgi:hypothetical protein